MSLQVSWNKINIFYNFNFKWYTTLCFFVFFLITLRVNFGRHLFVIVFYFISLFSFKFQEKKIKLNRLGIPTESFSRPNRLIKKDLEAVMNSSVISEYSCRDKSESKEEKKCRKLAVKEQKKVRNCFFTCASDCLGSFL